ncbi:MAG: hypothetical protein ACI8ZM_005255 [Crocinitomix sp.]|jgi:hypothetical protein
MNIQEFCYLRKNDLTSFGVVDDLFLFIIKKSLLMEQKKQILKASKVLAMSKSTKEKIARVAKDIQGKELFPEKINLAKKTLSKIKSLPV